MKALAVSLGVAFSMLVGSAGCEGTLIRSTDCGEIPSGGCIDKGSAVDQCQDPACTDLYSCIEDAPGDPLGTWQLARGCPARAPAPELPDGAAPQTDGGNDAAPREGGLPPDLPQGAYGGPGCVSLQLPDCALAVGYACATACCGCEELFVCESGGWESWGTCQADTPTPHPL